MNDAVPRGQKTFVDPRVLLVQKPKGTVRWRLSVSFSRKDAIL